ncbi:hypothetical protein PIB30_073185 [Stylosanthes scabra]|uniref:Uncharacterized protein n=1 Tax=Stylosanthes scabra TaxID=79078 RepID=A0ABU6VPB6_9FABA|nr:hypothetical protein [Stylosanthes scabra]
MRLTREGIHTLIRSVSFPSPTYVGLTFHPPKGAQRPRWHTGPGSSSDTICNSPDLPLARYCPLCGFHAPPHSFVFDKSMDDSQSPQDHLSKGLLLGRGINTLIRSVSFPSPTNVGLTLPLTLVWLGHA